MESSTSMTTPTPNPKAPASKAPAPAPASDLHQTFNKRGQAPPPINYGQEFVRYGLTFGYLYLAQLAFNCPCSKILGCHAEQWLAVSTTLTVMSAVNLFGYGQGSLFLLPLAYIYLKPASA
jgi:hypothetical protein